MVASVIAPVFAPMGFGDWRISTALITGFMAKESVVSTLSVLFGNTAALLGCITPVSAASLLVFCLLYTPCVAAIASIKRELGSKWAAGVVIGQCVIAWVAAFVVYLVGGFYKRKQKLQKLVLRKKRKVTFADFYIFLLNICGRG